MLSDRELERYKRQLMLCGFTKEHQDSLKSSTAVIAGIGGLGGAAAVYLAVAGIGRLVLVHYGNLTESNMNRQILMKNANIGLPRVDQAKDTINTINSYVEVITLNQRIESSSISNILEGANIALSARPNFYERRILNAACIQNKIPMIEAAMNGMEGYMFNVINEQTPCLECVFPEDDPNWKELGFPVLGAVSGMLGCLMSIEAVKILTGFANPLIGKMFLFNTIDLEFKKVKIYKDENCRVCSQRQ
ncbi:UBA/THIF-type NAD/FAD binding protein [Candidatus Magnetoovum chiemensis]|nr:UBA/THIF-type NAD/FAD binding protein [Candidatus Magnetoovum chiemensis]